MHLRAVPIRCSLILAALLSAGACLAKTTADSFSGQHVEMTDGYGNRRLVNAANTFNPDDAAFVTAAELAQEARNRWDAIGGMAGLGPRAEIHELSLILARLLQEHPKSREAMLARRGRLIDVDPQLVATYADAWRAANPDAVDIGPAPAQSQAEAAAMIGGFAAVVPPKPAPSPSWFRAAPVAPVAPQAAKPTQPAAAPPVVAERRDGPQRLATRDLYERLKKTTVLIIQLGQARDGRYLWFSHGTGSFIGPKTVLTNTHVVEASKGVPAQYFLIVNRELGVSRATLRARAQTASGRGIDAAVLDVTDVTAENFLTFASDFTEGDDVVLSGFAGRANDSDRAYIDLQEMVNSGVLPGADSIPVAKFSSGEIQSVYIDERGEETVAAGVIATSGASGSSLTDYCGRVVGLYYASTRQITEVRGNKVSVDAVKYNFSVSAREITKWLDSARVPYLTSAGLCPTAQ